jgi:hypothetical protein
VLVGDELAEAERIIKHAISTKPQFPA